MDKANKVEAGLGEKIHELLEELRPLGKKPKLRDIQAACAKRGLAISLMAARTFRRTTFDEHLAELRRKREAAEIIVQATDAGKTTSDAAMALAVQMRFDQLTDAEGIDSDMLSQIVLDVARAKASERQDRDVESKLRAREAQIDRLQFDAAKAVLKHLRELKDIAADRKLADPAKLERIRKTLFGQVPADFRPVTAAEREGAPA